MRSLEDARSRWQVTATHLTTLQHLGKSVKFDSDENPCTSGLRSVCWKTFLLFQHTNTVQWSQALADSRSAYSALKGHLIRFLDNPDELGTSLDPLDDDKDSPWNTLRQDDDLRAEIFQDVERCMPEEPYFRKPETQRMLLDILFVFCKINQDVGYRQGMHEILAPLLWVVDQDSVEKSQASGDDEIMQTVLDQEFIEHDSFTLLSLIMRSAKSFYELGEPEKKAGNLAIASSAPQQGSPIITRSKRIHEEYLARVDPELANHLTKIEVLPQIFLIRWIRLLFGREFPFQDLLGMWDTIFAEDPNLDSIDLVCVAMLLRIRWELLDSSYSFALMLLLKYPSPPAGQGPQTFVEDATFLRNHMNASGGATIITKYSGKSPEAFTPTRSSTPLDLTSSPTQKLLRTRSPLPSAASFLQQQGSVGELFQGAARGLLDQGERLGINKAVRDAVGEAKKNMQTLQASRNSSYMGRTSSSGSRWSLDDGRKIQSPQSLIAAYNARNRQLAGMLDGAMSELRTVTSSTSEDKEEYIKAIELAVAKVEFVKVYLEDSTMPLPTETPKTTTTSHAEGESGRGQLQTGNSPLPQQKSSKTEEPPLKTNTEPEPVKTFVPPTKKVIIRKERTPTITLPTEADSIKDNSAGTKETLTRPAIPLPTRSSIAQSNFAWMLEPDEASGDVAKSPPQSSSPFSRAARKPTAGASREKAAFLFGEDNEDILSRSSPRIAPSKAADDGFDMATIKGSKADL